MVSRARHEPPAARPTVPMVPPGLRSVPVWTGEGMIGRMRLLPGAETKDDEAKNEATSEAQFIVEEVTDSVEIARFRAQDERFRRNSDWLESHWAHVLPQARGKFLSPDRLSTHIWHSSPTVRRRPRRWPRWCTQTTPGCW